MNTTTTAVVTGLIITTGRWADKKPLNVNVAVGITVYAVILSILEDANAKFASQVALLVLVTAAFRYLPKVVQSTVGGRK